MAKRKAEHMQASHASSPLQSHCQPTPDPIQFAICQGGDCPHCISCIECQSYREVKSKLDHVFGTLRTARDGQLQHHGHEDGGGNSRNPTIREHNKALERIRELEAKHEDLEDNLNRLTGNNANLRSELRKVRKQIADADEEVDTRVKKEPGGDDSTYQSDTNSGNEERADSERRGVTQRQVDHVSIPRPGPQTKPPPQPVFRPLRPATPRDITLRTSRASIEKEKAGGGPWTAREDKRLRKGVRKKYTAAEIRQEHGLERSASAIRNRIANLRLRSKDSGEPRSP